VPLLLLSHRLDAGYDYRVYLTINPIQHKATKNILAAPVPNFPLESVIFQRIQYWRDRTKKMAFTHHQKFIIMDAPKIDGSDGSDNATRKKERQLEMIRSIDIRNLTYVIIIASFLY
jgi:hypothetical protein